MNNKVDARNMKQEKKRELKPKLRFPEFHDAPDWEQITLDDIASFYKGKGISKADIDVQGETPCIRYGELYTIYGEVIKTVISKTNLPASKLFLSQENDLLIPSSGETTLDIAKASCVLLNDVALGGDLNILRSNENGVFLSYLLNGPYKREIAKKAQGDTVAHLYASQLKLLEVGIPKDTEQQKIANCLSSLDELIATQSQKLDTLKTHKKGLLQQLFPAAGETMPKQRFPEFKDAPEWEEMKLLKVCDINPSTGELPESFIYIDLESVVDGNLIYNKKIYRDDAPSRAQRLLKNGDVIYQMVRPYQRNNFFCDFDDKNTYVASTGYAQLRSFDVSKFLYQLIHTDPFVAEVIARCTGSNYPAINSSELAKITVTIPKAPEQQKIADCLSSLDERIAAQTEKLEMLKAHKKGLLQQLFPSPDGVHG